MSKTLDQLAREYAEETVKYYPNPMIFKAIVRTLIEEAYEQGWVDRDTRDLETKKDKQE